MQIELHINGNIVKLWHLPYTFASGLTMDKMKAREIDLKDRVLDCKLDALPAIYENEYQMYAVVRSKLDPAKISNEEYNDFLIQVAKNKTKAA